MGGKILNSGISYVECRVCVINWNINRRAMKLEYFFLRLIILEFGINESCIQDDWSLNPGSLSSDSGITERKSGITEPWIWDQRSLNLRWMILGSEITEPWILDQRSLNLLLIIPESKISEVNQESINPESGIEDPWIRNALSLNPRWLSPVSGLRIPESRTIHFQILENAQELNPQALN